MKNEFEKVLNTLKAGRYMVETRDDGIYIRLAGSESSGYAFSDEFVKVYPSQPKEPSKEDDWEFMKLKKQVQEHKRFNPEQKSKPIEKERIEVSVIRRRQYADPRIKDTDITIHPKNGGIAEWQLPLLKNAIEAILNERDYHYIPGFQMDTIKYPTPKQEVLFVTEDGVEYRDGEKKRIWAFHTGTNHWHPDEHPEYYKELSNHYNKFFSTKEAAENFVTLNKPCLSVQDACDIYEIFFSRKSSSFRTVATEKAKQKSSNQ